VSCDVFSSTTVSSHHQTEQTPPVSRIDCILVVGTVPFGLGCEIVNVAGEMINDCRMEMISYFYLLNVCSKNDPKYNNKTEDY